MDDLHPVMVEALRGHAPPTEPEPTPVGEKDLLAADLYNMLNKERIRDERALAMQIRYGDGQ